MKIANRIMSIAVVIISLFMVSFVKAQPPYDFVDLGTLGGDNSSAYCVNPYGQIVGVAQDASGFFRATLFDPTGSGNNIDLGTLGGQNSCAFSINRFGQIVGTAQNSAGLYKAVVFDAAGEGNNIDLDVSGLAGTARSNGNFGQILGTFGDYAMDTEAMFFSSVADGNNVPLGEGVDLPVGWILQQANSVNDYGWIVGRAVNFAGISHAFLLTPTFGAYPPFTETPASGTYQGIIINFADLVTFADKWLE